MFYSVKLSFSEQNLLIDLIGKPLDAIVYDVWMMEMNVSGQCLCIVPEEVSTPDSEHKFGDVKRPKVAAISQLGIHSEDHYKEHLGIIESVNIFSVLTAFTPPKLGQEIILPNGVVIPRGIDYGYVYYQPSKKRAIINFLDNNSALIDLDIAVELVTETYPSILAYTSGYFINVSLDGLPQDEGWAENDFFLRKKLNK